MRLLHENRVAVVTGGSGGIGSAVAARLAADGFDVVVTYASNQAGAEQAVGRVRQCGHTGIAMQADVADERDVAAVFDAAESVRGGVDAVVHTAGRAVGSPLADLDLDTLDSLHRTNIRGTFVVSQQAVRRLRDGGSLVNFSSSVVGVYPPTWAAYAASKGAVEALTMVIAKELRGRDINVNAIAPGPTATAAFLAAKDAQTIDHLAKQPPLERLGRPEEIAEVVAFLVSRGGHWINSQVVSANGGII
jgi:3-oxoacyl-[acyl-carrier protein] reductase